MVIIEGIAFPLDTINKNGWGVPAAEADNAISSLKNAVIRVCPRDAPHGCDFSEDPKAEIGRVLDAWKEGNDVKARADITDSAASQKIADGTWKNTWSIYSRAAAISDGWANGVQARSLTLVNNPAWETATWQIAASDDGQFSLRFFNEFSIVASVDDTMTENETKTPPTGGVTPTELEKQIADKQKEIDDLKTKAESLEKENTNLKEVVASHEKDKATSVPLEKVQELVASKAEEVSTAKIAAYKEELARSSAMARLAAARKEVNLETNEDDYKHLTAADIEKLAEDLGKIKLGAASASIKYPTSKSSGTVGRWDSTKKEWVV